MARRGNKRPPKFWRTLFPLPARTRLRNGLPGGDCVHGLNDCTGPEENRRRAYVLARSRAPYSVSQTGPSVIFYSSWIDHILDSDIMTYLPSSQAPLRAPRASFTGTTPAVLRCQDGHRVQGKLQVISVTGGLLCLSKPLDHGCRVKLMFLTGSGSVMGAAEMLSPVSRSLQPFKFLDLHRNDQRRLQVAIQSSLDEGRRDLGQMERFRAW